MKRTGLKRVISGILALCFGAVAMFCLFQLSSILLTYRTGAEGYNALTQFVTRTPEPVGPEEDFTASPDFAENLPHLPNEMAISFPEVDFAGLAAINPDVVAWLVLEDTPLNYPLVQGRDNTFYLNHMFDGTQSPVGALFVDSRNAPGFADQNTVIYGHHMKDGSMFAVLKNYSNQGFYEEHPQMLLLTPEGNYLVELFAGYATAITADSWRHSFDDAADFLRWVAEAKHRSDFVSDVELGSSDRVVTLSTCSYVFDNARYVVHGRLVPVA